MPPHGRLHHAVPRPSRRIKTSGSTARFLLERDSFAFGRLVPFKDLLYFHDCQPSISGYIKELEAGA
jgi:hypothetical protein